MHRSNHISGGLDIPTDELDTKDSAILQLLKTNARLTGLDDSAKVNYAKFDAVLAKIEQTTGGVIMHEDGLVLCLKIAQQQWIELLKDGSAWFGKINNYIEKAIESNNDDQGDRYEGVFARTPKESSIVEKYSLLFGDDLEIIDDGEFCFLRRKSSKLQKAFCMYGIKKSELEITEVINPNDEVPLCRYQYFISPRMYNGFLQDGSTPADVAGFYCSAGHINSAIEQALRSKGYRWKRAMIEYDIDLSQEFFIEPLDGYPELWHKRIDLAYQHESRIVIYDNDDGIKGIALPYKPLSENSGNWAPGELYLQGEATAYRRKLTER